MRKLAGKAHPNIYEVVSLFKSEQAATEVTLMHAGSSWGTASEEEEKVQKPRKETRDHQGEVQGG